MNLDDLERACEDRERTFAEHSIDRCTLVCASKALIRVAWAAREHLEHGPTVGTSGELKAALDALEAGR